MGQFGRITSLADLPPRREFEATIREAAARAIAAAGALEWVLEAKRADTRSRRITQAVAWMAEGKSRHWRYQA